MPAKAKGRCQWIVNGEGLLESARHHFAQTFRLYHVHVVVYCHCWYDGVHHSLDSSRADPRLLERRVFTMMCEIPSKGLPIEEASCRYTRNVSKRVGWW